MLLAANIAVQIGLGAYHLEFSSDDASHYVTGLMIRDWLASGAYRDPMGYAVAYHAHYPVLGLGLWGPAFYGVEALWSLLFGASRIAAAPPPR